MLMSKNVDVFGLPRDLGDGLTLRWARPEDVDELAEFNSIVHSDTAEPDENIRMWIYDLFRENHPTTGPGDFTVVVDEKNSGKIISSLNLISQTWAYAGIPFGVGRPEVVGTNPDYRRKKLVKIQMDVVHAKSAARGELVQGITGIPWYYRQFGYAMALNLSGARWMQWSSVTKLEAGQEESYRLRPATISDLPVLTRLYQIHSAPGLISRVKTETEWHYELTIPDKKNHFNRNYSLIENITGEPIGYVEAKPAQHGPYAVRELAVLPGYSLRMVCEFLARYIKVEAEELNKERKNPIICISWAFGAEHPAYTALGNQLDKPLSPYSWFIRVADLPRFIRHIASALEKRLVGSVMEGYSGTLRLNFYHSNLTIVFDKGKLTEVGTFKPTKVADGDALFPDLTFLQVLFGHRSLSELNYIYPDCYATNERSALLINTLFPKQASEVVALD